MPSPDMNSNWQEQHPDEGLLHEWLDEQLATDDAARVAAHVSACHECRARVAEAHGLIAASRRILSALDNVPGSVIPSSAAFLSRPAPEELTAPPVAVTAVTPLRARVDVREFHWRRWGTMAAVLLLAVTGIVVVKQDKKPVIALPSPAPVDRRADLPDTIAARERTVSAVAASAVVTAPATIPASANEPAQRAASTPVTAQKAEARNAAELRSIDAGKSLAKTATKPSAMAAAATVSGSASAPSSPPASTPVSAPARAPASAPPIASMNAPVRATTTVAGAGGAAAAQGGAAASGDTLSARLEAERKRRMSAEAIAADANARPRIDAVGASEVQAFSARTKTSIPKRDSLAPSTTLTDKAFSALAPVMFDSLTLTREPCFGTCPAYDLMVDGTGHVRYQSHHPNDTTREQRAQLTASELSRLQRLLQQAHVETLTSFMPGMTTCGLAATDMPSLRLRVFQRGRWYVVEQYLGCNAGTRVLPRLATQIDAIVGTRRWLPSAYRIN